MYPETSVLDEFMLSKGLHKNLRKNVKVVNGEVRFNVYRGEKKKKKSFRFVPIENPDSPGFRSSTSSVKKNFFEVKMMEKKHEEEKKKRMEQIQR